MKIALVCTGLGHVWRGYERFTRDLFDLVKDDLDIILFKGAGKTNSRERTLPHLSGVRVSTQIFTYAMFLIPHLLRHRYEIVHYSEPGLGNLLYHAKRKLGLKTTLLFSNGVGLSPAHTARIDHIHELTDLYANRAREAGIPAERISLIPYGIDSRLFARKNDNRTLRINYGIPESSFVILSVAALNRTHKRIDYLIEEIARLPQGFFLTVCGQIEDPSLVRFANKLLPGRHKFLSVPFEAIPEMYKLADVFAHTALEEGFCLALVEAVCSGLPVIAHDAPHFEWLLGGRDDLIDLSIPGNLASRILNLKSQISNLKSRLNRAQTEVILRFDWQNLKKDYLAMYKKLLDNARLF